MTPTIENFKMLKRGVSWSAFERLAVQGIQFLIFIFMARVLSPTDYGLVGMLTFFIIISQLIAEGGLSQAIIRKLNRDELDLSTSFYVNIVGGVFLYLLLYIIAPAIADFYEEPRLIDLLRVMAISIPIQSSLVIHRAVLTSKLDFKTQAKSTFIGALASGVIGLYLAYGGYGVWSIVGLQLSNQIATALTLWLVTEWRPKWCFSMSAFRNLYGLGSKLLVSNVIESIYQSLYIVTIGKVFSAYALGCYTNACQLGSFSSENPTRIVNRAVFPLFCGYQHDYGKLREAISKYLQLSFFFIAPMMMGLAVISEPLTLTLIGEQWLYTARLLRILCLYFLSYPLISINFMILEIHGKGSTYLKMMSWNIMLGVGMLLIMIHFGLSAVCVGMVVRGAVNFAINAHISGKYIGLQFRNQLQLILPTAVIALVMSMAVYGIQLLVEDAWVKVCIGIMTGFLIYCGLSIIFQSNLCRDIVKLLSHHNADNG